MPRHAVFRPLVRDDPPVDVAPAPVNPPAGLELHPERLAAGALLGLLLLIGVNLAATAAFLGSDNGLVRRIATFLRMDAEASLPTLVNFGLLVGCLFLLVTLTLEARAAGDPWRRHWLWLCLIFLWLAYDEAAGMHEQLVQVMGRVVDRAGIFYFAWVIPGAIFALAVAIAFFRFVLALRRPEAWFVLLGGALYVVGALGLEMIGGMQADDHGLRQWTYQLFATLDETLEMAGLTIFGYALLRLLADPDGIVRLGTPAAERGRYAAATRRSARIAPR